MRRRRFNHEEAAKRWRRGERPVDLAREYGVTVSSIIGAAHNVARRRNMRRPKVRTSISGADRQFITENWATMSDSDMAKQLKRTRHGVMITRIRMRLLRQEKREDEARHLTIEKLNLPKGLTPEATNAVRCRLHLLDLKKAGYPYAYGEPGRPGYAPL